MKLINIRVIEPPTELPVTAEEFINHARLNGITAALQPDAIDRRLAAATRRAERFMRRSVMTQTVEAIYVDGGPPDLMLLPRGNVQEVLSVNVNDTPVSNWVLEGNAIRFTAPAYNTGSPVIVTWLSGYGDDPASVPDLVREGILEYATTLYEDRDGRRVSQYESGADGLPEGIRDAWRSEQIEV
jgi:hypothetical protein